MRRFSNQVLTFFCILILFIGTLLILIYMKKQYSNWKIEDKIIIAKDNISTPEKYNSSIKIYLNFIISEFDDMILKLSILEKKLKEGKLNKAQKAYIHAHQHYEAIRPIIILFGNTDRIINARADYFINGIRDYRFRGFHLIEYQLFCRKNIKAALNVIDQLSMILNDIKKRISIENFDINNILQFSSDFIEMILEIKLAGKENVYSLSDLNDIAANLRGSKEVIKAFTPFITKKILLQILHNYKKINDILSHYKLDNGEYKSYTELVAKDKMAFYSILSQQAEFLATLRSELNINLYHKY
ncbi:MAG: EfeM/EfeO family lipoprotein [Arsenophonus sp. ER-EMS1-MAG3]